MAELRAKAAPVGRRTVESVREEATRQAGLIQQRVSDSRNRASKLKQTSDDLQAAIKSGDIDRVRIISADFKTAHDDMLGNTKDLAEAMAGLGQGFKDIGIALDDIQKLTPEEQSLIDSADALVTRKSAELLTAEQGIIAAEGSWVMKASRVATATAARDRVKSDLDDAKASVGTAKEMAEKRMRDRLQNMSLDQSLQRLQSVTQQIIEIAKDRIGEIETNLGAIESGRVQTFADLQIFSKQVEEGTRVVNDINAQLAELDRSLSDHVENSSEWVAIKDQIETKRNELREAEGDKNKAFTLAQDGQRFIEMYKLQESSQRGLLAFHKIWIATLEEGVKQRTTLFESHLGVIRAAHDQQAMSMVDSVAVETDERITQDAAKHNAAIMGNLLGKIESFPEQVKRMRQITAANAEKVAEFDAGMAKALDAFYKNFGTEHGYDDSGHYGEPQKASA